MSSREFDSPVPHRCITTKYLSMSIKFNEVTWYSKLAAALFFLGVLPVLVYYITVQYNEVKDLADQVKNISANPLNGTYLIDEQKITFVNGVSEQEIAPGSAAKMVTRIFGEPVHADVNSDGQKDAIFFVSQETGGTGIFFYVAAALKQGSGYVPVDAIFLGDRIAPQNIVVTNGIAVVNYADRLEGEPMSAQPSMGRSRFFIVRDGAFVEGEQEWDVKGR